MDDVTLKDILMRQGRALSVLAIRITTLEKLLLEKGVITEEETIAKTKQLDEEYAAEVQQAFRQAIAKREAEGE